MRIRSQHPCEPPRRRPGRVFPWADPIGQLGDLWLCDCGQLWRIGHGCDFCDRHGERPHGGQHCVLLRWRPARLRDKIRFWRRRSPGIVTR